MKFNFFNRYYKLLILFILFFTMNTFFILGVSAENKRDNEYLVKYRDNDQVQLVVINSENNAQTLSELNLNPQIDYIEPNYLYQASIIPSDTYFNKQWYLERIQAVSAWDIINSSPDIVIAIIDSGVQIDHPDLKNNIWKNIDEIPDNGIDDDRNGFIDDYYGWDFTNNTNDPQPKFEEGYTLDGVMHGTIVAGIAAAEGNNASGITGVSWNSKIMSLKVLDDKGEGDTRDVIRAIDYAISNGADIINFSFVGDGYSRSLETAIRRAYNAGILMVAAAGNDIAGGHGSLLDETPMYPVCHDGDNGENMVIGVAAVDDLDQKAFFSGYGSKCIDISAPGVSVYSTSFYSPKNDLGDNSFDNYYDGYWSGTSMAVPMVSGAVALIEQLNPKLNREEVIDILKNNSDNINKLNIDYIGKLGRGRLNIYKSLIDARERSNISSSRIIYAPNSGKEAIVNIVNREADTHSSFYAYDKNFRGGVNVAVGDVDGDGVNEIVTGAGNGGGPHVRVFDEKGNLKNHFFAYDKNFRGGVNVAVGDVDGDGVDEIVTGAGNSGGPHVRVFDEKGNLKNHFFAYDKNFRGGVNVAVGDVDGDGVDEIVTGAGKGGGPQVRIFDLNGKLSGQFFAYDNNFRGGVKVSVVNFDTKVRKNKEKIVVAPGIGGGPHIRIFDDHANLINQFFAFNENFHGGVNISSIDIDNDSEKEIIAAAGPGGAPHVRIFTKYGKLIDSFYAYEEDFSGGVNVSSIE